MTSEFHILLLAAGASRRMQQAKQLIRIDGQTLLERSINEALASKLGRVTVVYGAHRKQVLPLIEKWPVEVMYNSEWDEGLGSSIRNGVASIVKQYVPDNIIIMLADQPLVDATLLCHLATRHQQSGKMITACKYNKTLGVPVVFSPPTYTMLQKLRGDQGAKSLIVHYEQKGELTLFDAPTAAIDLDTPEDLSKFLG